MTGPRLALAGLVTAALTAVLGACGSETSPIDDVPELGERLDEVDAAVVDGRYGEARRALGEMTTLTEEARADGDLDSAEADDVLSAVGAMLEALPEGTAELTEPTEPTEPTSTPAEEPTEEPPLTIVPEDEGGEDEPSEEEREEEEKEREEAEKEAEKQREKEEKEREKKEKDD